jgi:hypothetical protein
MHQISCLGGVNYLLVESIHIENYVYWRLSRDTLNCSSTPHMSSGRDERGYIRPRRTLILLLFHNYIYIEYIYYSIQNIPNVPPQNENSDHMSCIYDDGGLSGRMEALTKQLLH